MAEAAAEPLRPLGCYRIEEKPATNALGGAVSGAALTAYWRERVEYCVGKCERRDSAAKGIDAAQARCDVAAASLGPRLRLPGRVRERAFTERQAA